MQQTEYLQKIDHEPHAGLTKQKEAPGPFVPRGAIAFFILLILLCGVIWFGIYFLMLQRA